MKTKENKDYTEYGINEPLENPHDDCLERALFAKRIFKLVEGTPSYSNITIGIHGTWGSGKTTVLNFIKYYCQKNGHPFVVFNPWQFRNRDEAWWGFISSIDKGIAIWQNKKIKIGTFKRQKFVKKTSEKFRELTAITSIGKVAGNLILAPLEGLLKQTKEKVQKELDKTLKDKRLFVFIDDLDRAEPDILYEVLMLLNEVVDLRRCIYVIGLDVDMASQIIEDKIGCKNGKGFLDKIINWPFNLPEPTDYEWRELIDKELEKKHGNIKRDVIQSILPYLPKNPRKIKLYLGYLSGLHKSFLERYTDFELDWKILYLAQLLRFEFPKFFEKMIKEKELIEDLASGLFTDRFMERDQRLSGMKSSKNGEEIKWKALIKKIISDMKFSDLEQTRINTLYEAIRNLEVPIPEQHLKNHLLVIEVPELFTWKEYYEFKEKLLSLAEERRIIEIKKFINSSKKEKELERVREFLKTFIRDREQLLSKESESAVKEEMDPLLEDAINVTKTCLLLLDINDIFIGINPIFNKDVFKEWYENLVKWAHFKTDERYTTIRNLEKEIAKKLASKMSNQVSLILEIIYKSDFDCSYFGPHAFHETHQEVKRMLEEILTEQLIQRFKEINGIEEIIDRNLIPEKHLLFLKKSIFHNKKVYKRLRKISNEIQNNINIQKNFYTYTRFLFFCTTEGCSEIRKDEAIELLKDKELLDIIWNATISKPLNLRSICSLEKSRKIIKKSILKDENALRVPQWWEEALNRVEKVRPER